MKILQRIDLFGTLCTFRFFESDKHHNIIGYTLSLILFITTIIFSYFFGLDFIFHTESRVLQSTRTRKNNEYYNLTMQNFFLHGKLKNMMLL